VLAEDGRLREVTGFFELSQLALAIQADVSTRHLSFVETGRSQPSRDLLPHLAEELDLPLRDRNHLLLAAGSAPARRSDDCTWGASSVLVQEVNGTLVQSDPVTTGCIPG
jgi:transcriptional regulator with XRE-family HTH domain